MVRSGRQVKLLFIVPAFNERESLPGVISELRAGFPDSDLMVVDDGSTDGTSRIARSQGARVLELPFNLGIGGAVQTGLLYAAANDYDVAVQFDGDGQHRTDQVKNLLEPIMQSSCDVALGSRYLERRSYKAPFMRRIGIAIFNLVNSMILRRRITDSTSGFRAYNRAALMFLAQDYPHDYPEPEVVVTLARHRFRIQEVPVLMRERADGRSSITFWKAIYYMGKVLVAIMVGATRAKKERYENEPASADYRYSR